MKKTLETVVFFGNERLATGVTTDCSMLMSLINTGYDVAAIVTNYTPSSSRGNRELEISKIAAQYNIPLFSPYRLSDIKEKIEECHATIGILVAYGKIIPQQIIDLFPRGIINIHPSLLPLHRGPTPIESVLLSGEKKTGVSIMRLVKEMDAGPVYGQSEVTLTGNETKQQISSLLLDIGQAMMIELLPSIINDTLAAIPQSESHATYDSLIKKQDGVIDWSKPAEQIERQVRAYATWPKSHTSIYSKEVIITKVSIVLRSGRAGTIDVSGKSIVIFCGRDALNIDKLKPSGKNEMSGQEFVMGYGNLFL